METCEEKMFNVLKAMEVLRTKPEAWDTTVLKICLN